MGAQDSGSSRVFTVAKKIYIRYYDAGATPSRPPWIRALLEAALGDLLVCILWGGSRLFDRPLYYVYHTSFPP